MNVFILSLSAKNNELLACCVESIQRHSPKTTITVFGDAETASGPYEIVDYHGFHSVHELCSRYRYAGPNPIEHEWHGVSRWLCYGEHAQTRGINQFFTCDADVLIFQDLNRLPVHNTDMGMSYIPEQNIWSGGCALFNNLAPLQTFSQWTRESLNTRYQLPGEWSDMWLWTDFLNLHPEIRIVNQSDFTQCYAIDPNLSLTTDWEAENGIKKIHFTRAGPYGLYQNRKVWFHALHCWGPSKENGRMREILDHYTYV